MTVTKGKSDSQIRREAILWLAGCIAVIGTVIGLAILTRGWSLLVMVASGALYGAYKIIEQTIRDNDDPNYWEGL